MNVNICDEQVYNHSSALSSSMSEEMLVSPMKAGGVDALRGKQEGSTRKYVFTFYDTISMVFVVF